MSKSTDKDEPNNYMVEVFANSEEDTWPSECQLCVEEHFKEVEMSVNQLIAGETFQFNVMPSVDQK